MQEGKVLCVRHNHYNVGVKQITDYWCLPGGGLEAGESLIDGVMREMVEETGVQPKIGNLLYVQQFLYHDREWLEFFFHITNAGDYVQIDLSKTTHGLHEIAEIAFIDPKTSPILPAFLATEQLEERIDAGTTAFFSSL